MTAREVDQTAKRLRDFRTQTVADLVLATAAFGLAPTASRLHELGSRLRSILAGLGDPAVRNQ
jgi:hypothetical protein